MGRRGPAEGSELPRLCHKSVAVLSGAGQSLALRSHQCAGQRAGSPQGRRGGQEGKSYSILPPDGQPEDGVSRVAHHVSIAQAKEQDKQGTSQEAPKRQNHSLLQTLGSK